MIEGLNNTATVVTAIFVMGLMFVLGKQQEKKQKSYSLLNFIVEFMSFYCCHILACFVR